MNLFDTAKSVPALDCAERYASVRVTRRGKRSKCCCPLHNEKTASCTFYEDTGTFYCFGCHEGGDSIHLVSKLFNLDRNESAKKICADFGLSPDKPSAPASDDITAQIILRKLRDWIKKYASFTHAVHCGKIRWCEDRLDEQVRDNDDNDDDMEILLDLRTDAEQLTDAIRENSENEGALYVLLNKTIEYTRWLYQFLAIWDQTSGTSYVKGVQE